MSLSKILNSLDESWERDEILLNIEKGLSKDEIVNEFLSKKHLLSADSKSQDLTVKKLTRNNPTMKQKFNDINRLEDEVA